MTKSELHLLTQRLTEFRDARDWQQFHSLKNLIISLNLEAGELLELTQWKNDDEFETSLNDPAARQNFEDECADVLSYLLLITERAGIDIVKITHDKIGRNEEKYPVAKSKGNARKYTQLRGS